MTSAVLTQSPATARPRLVSRALLLRFVSIVGSSIGFFLPLSVVPIFAKQAGSDSGAGFATVALLLATVAAELVTPRLIARIGYRWALTVGLFLLGAPILVLTATNSMTAIVVVNIVRGTGFAIVAVAGGAVTATLIPAERRGEGLAIVGLVSGVPSLLALPAGVWAAQRWGCEPVFVVTAAATLLALLSVPGLPRRDRTRTESQHGVLAGLRNSALTRPALIFTAATAAAGVVVTFLPLAMLNGPAWVATTALLVQSTAATAVRWFAGKLGDRHGALRLLAPGLLLTALGMASMAALDSPAAVIGGAALFGAGFGVLQNATLCLMYARVPAGGEGTVSAIWNAAYDLGMAAGALGAGLAVGAIGYPATFLLTAALAVPAFAVLRRERNPR
ncbi:MFS transporter [Labedaea rhizosphaerae]|uniref:Putative MFS family arabinose efflux permease n=1 Tax=Labedaea rhizosphaerae TaxID=598644 RepID=A0A4R6S9G3_LABRH|nr:MFS transporter [Labedaea rhizosphaerae]TDP96520.1 putative MFS family arabinose efflux permease [Labedaea rhizosphaerae]